MLSWESSNNVALHFSCSTTSRLHTFVLRRPCLLQASGCGWTGVNYSIFIYFCSHRSYVYKYVTLWDDMRMPTCMHNISSNKPTCHINAICRHAEGRVTYWSIFFSHYLFQTFTTYFAYLEKKKKKYVNANMQCAGMQYVDVRKHAIIMFACDMSACSISMQTCSMSMQTWVVDKTRTHGTRNAESSSGYWYCATYVACHCYTYV